MVIICYNNHMDKEYYKVMGLDYGDVRIGVALSDISRFLASGYETYTRKSTEKDLNHLSEIIKQNNVKKVVFGLPLNMDGSRGIRVEKTESFAQKLKEKCDVEIDYYDERLSSVSAEEILIEAGVKREKRKEVIDKLAATIILQSYLDLNKENK